MNEHEILQRLIPYVPPYWVRQAFADPHHTLVGREERIYTAVLFVDISGFTPMTEALSRKGREGIEEMSALLDRYFSVMSGPVMALGGEVVKFAGDALIVAFPAPSDGSDAHLGAALNCALQMQEAMSQFARVRTSLGTFPLRMKIGISEGAIYHTTVGGEDEMQPVFAGRPLARCQQAEDLAEAEEIIVDAALIGRMPGHLDIGEARGTFRVVHAAADMPALPPIQPPDVSALSLEQAAVLIQRLSPYLPRQLLERIRQGQRGVYGEHRLVTVMFVKFGGLRYDEGAQTGQVLQVYYTAMRDLVVKHGGRLNEVDIGAGGGMLVVFFGAPTAYEDSELQAMSCAWEMQQAVAEVRMHAGADAEHLRQSIGVAIGSFFVGDVGAPVRRTYAAVGDEVNLASRLAGLAEWGEVVSTPWVRKRTASRFDFEPMGQFNIKGKAEPVPLFALLAPHMDVSDAGLVTHLVDSHLFVGRETELRMLKEVQRRAWQKEPQLLLVSGGAGVGKSRLVGELVRSWAGSGGLVYVGDCRQQGERASCKLWVDLLRGVLGIQEGESPERRQERIESQLILLSPGLSGQIGVFIELLDLVAYPDPSQCASAAVEGQPRHHQALINLFLALAGRQPLLLVLEHWHDVDDESVAVLNGLIAQVKELPLVICVVYRPVSDPFVAEDKILTTRLSVSELPNAHSLVLARRLLEDAGLDISLASQLAAQAQGNPLYLHEMVRALTESSEGETVLSEDLSIPEGISGLIQSQLDRLDEDDKLTLRLGAVIGSSFDLHVLRAAYPTPISLPELKARLESLLHIGLLERGQDKSETSYAFKQEMLRQVIYVRLLSADRERFHRRVGQVLQELYADRLAEHYPMLAEHFYRGTDWPQAAIYWLKAGQHGAVLGAYREALEAYNRAEKVLQLCETDVRGQEFVRSSRLDLLLGRGDVQRHLLHIPQAVADYHRATQQATSLAHRRAQGEALFCAAQIALDQGRYSDAQVTVWQAMQRFATAEDRDGTARSLGLLGRSYALQGHLGQAEEYIQRALKIEADRQAPHTLVCSQMWLGGIQYATGRIDLAVDTLHQAVELGRTARATDLVARGLGQLAEVLLCRGRWGQALQLCREGLELLAPGDQLDVAEAYRVLGSVLTHIGAYDEANTYLDQAIDVFDEVRWHVGLAFCLCTWGEASLAEGQYERAQTGFLRALTLGRETNTVQATVLAQLGLSKLAAVEQDWAEEQRLCSEARAIARRSGLELLAVDARIGLARAYLGRQEWRMAYREALLARDKSQQLRCPYNLFRSAAMLGEAMVGLESPERAQQHLDEAGAIIAHLAGSLADPYQHIFLNRPYVRALREQTEAGAQA